MANRIGARYGTDAKVAADTAAVAAELYFSTDSHTFYVAYSGVKYAIGSGTYSDYVGPSATQLWKPLLDGDGFPVTDENGDCTMGLGPA